MTDMIDTEVLQLRVRRMRFKPGDVLVVQCDHDLSVSQQHRVQSVLRAMLPSWVRPLVIGPEWTLSVMTSARAAETLAENAP